MHFEILVEDRSGMRLLETLIPRIIGPFSSPHTWRLHPYKGVGNVPRGLTSRQDPAKRILLEQLPRLLRGYEKTPGIDAVIVVLDVDDRDCRAFLDELKAVGSQSTSQLKVLYRLAIEEVEAWYFGDIEAIIAAYPRAKRGVIDRYQPDSICGTWEKLADAIYPGGARAIKNEGWPKGGQVKFEWADRISVHMVPARNLSPSFQKFRQGLVALTGT